MKKVTIEKSCVCCGACLVSDLFVENEDGTVLVKGSGTINDAAYEKIKELIRLCPSKSIKVEEVRTKTKSEIKSEILKEIEAFNISKPDKKDFEYNEKYARFNTPYIGRNFEDFSSEKSAKKSAMASFNSLCFSKRESMLQGAISNYVLDKATPYITFEQISSNFYYNANTKAQKILDKVISYITANGEDNNLSQTDKLIQSKPDLKNDWCIEAIKKIPIHGAKRIISDYLDDKYTRLDAYELYIDIIDYETLEEGLFNRYKTVTKYNWDAQRAAKELTNDLTRACKSCFSDQVVDYVYSYIEEIVKNYNIQLKKELKEKLDKLLVEKSTQKGTRLVSNYDEKYFMAQWNTLAGELAGTAVGSATVGAAAGAVGLSSVATVASTSAGAAAVGAISTSAAVGLSNGVSAANKMKEASNTIDKANGVIKRADNYLKSAEEKLNNSLLSLGKVKLRVWQEIEKYVQCGSKVRNIPNEDKLELDGAVSFDKLNMHEFQNVTIGLKEVLAGGAAALTSAQVMGLATSAGFTSLATASTGAAISSLHGVAASNAALAALGGGAKAAGGLGMAGGSIVAGALTAAPALAITSIFLNKKSSKNLDEANDALYEAKEYFKRADKACSEMGKLRDLSNSMEECIKEVDAKFRLSLEWLEKLVSKKTDFVDFTESEKKEFFITFKLAKILKDLTLTQLMDAETNELETESVNSAINREIDNFKKLV